MLFSNVKGFDDLPFLSMIGFEDNVIYEVLNITLSDSKVDFTNNEITFNIWNGLSKDILENQPPMLEKLMKRIRTGSSLQFMKMASDDVLIEALDPYFNVTELAKNGSIGNGHIIEHIIKPYIKASDIHKAIFKKDSVYRNDKGEIDYGYSPTILALKKVKDYLKPIRDFAAYNETGLPSWMVIDPNDYRPLTEIATYPDFQEYAEKVKKGDLEFRRITF